MSVSMRRWSLDRVKRSLAKRYSSGFCWGVLFISGRRKTEKVVRSQRGNAAGPPQKEKTPPPKTVL